MIHTIFIARCTAKFEFSTCNLLTSCFHID